MRLRLTLALQLTLGACALLACVEPRFIAKRETKTPQNDPDMVVKTAATTTTAANETATSSVELAKVSESSGGNLTTKLSAQASLRDGLDLELPKSEMSPSTPATTTTTTTEKILKEVENLGVVEKSTESSLLRLMTPMKLQAIKMTTATPSRITSTVATSHENDIELEKVGKEKEIEAGNTSLRPFTEKRAKFINENSTNAQQLSWPTAAEVWSLASMKAVPKLPISSTTTPTTSTRMGQVEPKTVNATDLANNDIEWLQQSPNQHHHQNQSGLLNEKNLFDWHQIMMHEAMQQENGTEFQLATTLEATEAGVHQATTRTLIGEEEGEEKKADQNADEVIIIAMERTTTTTTTTEATTTTTTTTTEAIQESHQNDSMMATPTPTATTTTTTAEPPTQLSELNVSLQHTTTTMPTPTSSSTTHKTEHEPINEVVVAMKTDKTSHNEGGSPQKAQPSDGDDDVNVIVSNSTAETAATRTTAATTAVKSVHDESASGEQEKTVSTRVAGVESTTLSVVEFESASVTPKQSPKTTTTTATTTEITPESSPIKVQVEQTATTPTATTTTATVAILTTPTPTEIGQISNEVNLEAFTLKPKSIEDENKEGAAATTKATISFNSKSESSEVNELIEKTTTKITNETVLITENNNNNNGTRNSNAENETKLVEGEEEAKEKEVKENENVNLVHETKIEIVTTSTSTPATTTTTTTTTITPLPASSKSLADLKTISKVVDGEQESSLETNNISEILEATATAATTVPTPTTSTATAEIVSLATPTTTGATITTTTTEAATAGVKLIESTQNINANTLNESETEAKEEGQQKGEGAAGASEATGTQSKSAEIDHYDEETGTEDALQEDKEELKKASTTTTTTTTTTESTNMATGEQIKKEEVILLTTQRILIPTTTTTTTEAPIISLLDDSSTTTTTTTVQPITTTTTIKIASTTESLPIETTTEMLLTELVNKTVTTFPPTTTTTSTESDQDAFYLATTAALPLPSGEPTLQRPNSTSAQGETDVNVIIAITVSVIGVVALILLVAFLYLMRKRQKQTSYGQRCRPVSLDAYSLDNVSVLGSVRRKGGRDLRASKRTYGNAAFDDPSLRHNLLTATELSKFVERRSSIFEEFRDVPQIIARADEVPSGCEDKNRYANVIPLPESRVVLQRQSDDDKTEYINANYVRGPQDVPNYYIACQAPLESTICDFWRMIWEQQSRVIIQATDLSENGIERCAEYLPPSATLDNHSTYGDYQVTLKNREVKDKYAISTLMLKRSGGEESRELTHYWYKWPETGVPAEEAPIIAMLLEARSSLKSYAIEQANELKEKSSTLTMKSMESSLDSDTKKAEEGGSNSSNGSATSNNEINGNVSAKAARSQQGPLTIHCSPGTGRTGTIITCDMAIRSLETPKRSVDIPQLVYYVRRGRASAVQTKEQYEFIYKVANMYATKITNLSNDN